MEGNVKEQEIKLASTSSPKSKKFVEGVSGNSSDRKKCTVAQAARAALARPIPNDPDGRSFAEGIMLQLAWKALAGDRAAAHELINRAEGTPRQTLDANDDRPDPLRELIEYMTKRSEILGPPDGAVEVMTGVREDGG